MLPRKRLKKIKGYLSNLALIIGLVLTFSNLLFIYKDLEAKSRDSEIKASDIKFSYIFSPFDTIDEREGMKAIFEQGKVLKNQIYENIHNKDGDDNRYRFIRRESKKYSVNMPNEECYINTDYYKGLDSSIFHSNSFVFLKVMNNGASPAKSIKVTLVDETADNSNAGNYTIYMNRGFSNKEQADYTEEYLKKRNKDSINIDTLYPNKSVLIPIAILAEDRTCGNNKEFIIGPYKAPYKYEYTDSYTGNILNSNIRPMYKYKLEALYFTGRG